MTWTSEFILDDLVKKLGSLTYVRARLYDGYQFYLTEYIEHSNIFIAKFRLCPSGTTYRINFNEIKEVVLDEDKLQKNI